MAQILIVDDDESMRTLIKEVLIVYGHDCELAEAGPEALEILRKKSFDLAIIDRNMPGMDGLELVTLRGRAMQEAAEATPSGMVALIGADEAQAEEKPVEAPLILNCDTRLKFTVPEMEATMPSGGQRMTPCLRIFSKWWPSRKGEPADAA
jgi:CheY-like chemotaxis protein